MDLGPTELAVGNVVRVKDDPYSITRNPLMTVHSIHGNAIRCVWFTPDATLMEEEFPRAMLQFVRQ